jgi:hypothetical protein
VRKGEVVMKGKKGAEDVRRWFRYQFFGSASVRLSGEDAVLNATIANISLSGLGLYSTSSLGKGKKVEVTICFVDKNGKVEEATATGRIDWQKKFLNMYLIGIIFDEELNAVNQPKLLEHLSWLIDTYKWPEPYRDKRIAML